MKRRLVIVCLLLACFLSGCGKQEIDTPPANDSVDTNSTITEPVVGQSENENGMRFNTTLDEFVERYNQVTVKNNNASTQQVLTLDDFQKLNDRTDNNGVEISSYVYYDKEASKLSDNGAVLFVYVEAKTGKICRAYWQYTEDYLSKVSESKKEHIIKFDVPNLYMALNTDIDYNSAVQIVEKIANLENYGCYYDSGVDYTYTIDTKNKMQLYIIWAMDKDRYRTIYEQYQSWFEDNKSSFTGSQESPQAEKEQWSFVQKNKSYTVKEDSELHNKNYSTSVKIGETIPEGYYLITSLAGHCTVASEDEGQELGKGMYNIFFLADGTKLRFQHNSLTEDGLAELKLTKAVKHELEEGTYIAGKDIPAGIYIIDCETYCMSYTGVYYETNSKKHSAGANLKITLKPGQEFRLFHEPESIEGTPTLFQLYEVSPLEN